MNEGRNQAREEFGVEMRWIPDLVRSVPGPASKIVSWAISENARSGGVVALGLGGPEKKYPPNLFKKHFYVAGKAGLPANPHAGEEGGPENVRQCIDLLNATRIGHGVRAIENQELVAYLAEKQIPLEVCPTSNVKLGVYSSYREHPLRRLFEAGCAVTINTDDPVLFSTTLTEEYAHAVEDCGLSLPQVRKASLAAVKHSYLPEKEKEVLMGSFEKEFKTLIPDNVTF
jgi:aminodeoxyfutalosine deaminase